MSLNILKIPRPKGKDDTPHFPARRESLSAKPLYLEQIRASIMHMSCMQSVICFA
jgi:hypothetical protein